MSDALTSRYSPKKGILVIKARISLCILRSARSVTRFLVENQRFCRELSTPSAVDFVENDNLLTITVNTTLQARHQPPAVDFS